MIAHRVEGIAIAPVSDRSRGHLERLTKFGVQFVLIDRTVAGRRLRRRARRQRRRRAAPRRAPDRARAPAHRLHRRVGRRLDCARPASGYMEALERPASRSIPSLIVARDRRPRGRLRRRCGSCSSSSEPPTAVFTVNNLVALGAIEGVRGAGPRGAGRRRARLLRRHRVRIAALPVPHRDGAAGGDARDPRHAAPARADRGPGARPQPGRRPPRASSSFAGPAAAVTA